MEQIKVKTEHLPTRCEICHQTDKFNPIENYCTRCNKVYPKEQSKPLFKFSSRFVETVVSILVIVLILFTRGFDFAFEFFYTVVLFAIITLIFTMGLKLLPKIFLTINKSPMYAQLLKILPLLTQKKTNNQTWKHN